MGNVERPYPFEGQPELEILDPRHFFAAYIFDRAAERAADIQRMIESAQEMSYPVRYWWLSDAMELQGSPDRLIICIHHPSRSEDAGMDLYNALKQEEVSWDDLEVATMDEYRVYGKHV